jgi:OOP family OmpA-OmpF porin
LLATLTVLANLSAFSQSEWGWDWKDSSKIAVKQLPQFNEFLNNQYPYPAKPRNQWELGIGAGISSIVGDVKSNTGFTGTISLRKAIGHVLSVRGSLAGLFNSGSPSPYGVAVGQAAYKNQAYVLGADLIASLNTASHYRGNPKTNIYLLAGYSLIGSKVQFKNAPSGAQPDQYSIFYGQRPGMANTQNGLITTLGGESVNNRKSYSLLHGINVGLGIAFKVSDKINIGAEQKYIFTAPGYDYLDGWKEANNNDYLTSTTLKLNINLGNSDKKVQPLYWINPNNFVYSELNSPKHMKLPKVVLPDGDKDGVTDQFDMEPNSPKGAPVDSHGVSKDTDGDGVPDYRDKELLTAQKCFPVNIDGIGNCPEPACCKEIKDMIATMKPAEKPECAIGALPSVQFRGGAKLSKDAQAVLSAAAASLKANPACNVKVIGYGASSKSAQQQSWDRVNAVIKYLVEKQGIAESRLLFVYAQDGDANTVDLQGTTEEGPNTVPAPHPNLKSKN